MKLDEHNSPNYYFKQTFLGEVLMIKDKKPSDTEGEWIYFYRKATSYEAQMLLNFI